MNKEPGLNNPEVDSSRETLQDRGQKSTEGKRASEINYALEKEKVHAYEKEKEFASAEEIESATAKAIESAETERNNLKEEIAAQLGLNPNDPDDAKKIDWIATQYAKTKMQESVEAKAETELKVDPEIITTNKGLKKIFLKIGAMALASAISIGAFLAYRNNKDNGGGNVPPIALEQIQDNNEVNLNTPEVKEAEMGIKDGYGEKGMWLSENKSGPLAFASATEVAEACDGNEKEMVKYTTRNQVESFADYLANLPEQIQPEGFKGLSLKETEAKLEGLSPEEYTKVKEYFDGVIENSTVRKIDINRQCMNAYMDKIDPNGEAVHKNMELVACATNENIRACEFVFHDDEGNEIGSLISKIIYDQDGNIVGGCMQVINMKEGTTIYHELRTVPGDTPTSQTPDNPVIPVVPVAPEKPDEPVTPEKPDKPVTPEKPDKPVTPEKPDIPTELESKDAENMIRIDNNIQKDIAENIGSEKVTVEQTTVTPEEVTTQPVSTNETAPTIVQNEAAPEATVINPSEYNSIAEDLGGANVGYEYAPVQSDEVAQAIADAAEIPINQAPASEQDINDALSDLGIN